MPTRITDNPWARGIPAMGLLFYQALLCYPLAVDSQPLVRSPRDQGSAHPDRATSSCSYPDGLECISRNCWASSLGSVCCWTSGSDSDCGMAELGWRGSRAATSHQVPRVAIEDLKRGLAELGCTVSIKGKAHLEGSMRKNKYKTLVIQTADYMLK